MSISIPSSTLEKFTTFGDLLRFLRRRMGITQIDLAIAVGYSDTQISRLEQNLRLPDIPTIEARFVSALGLEQEPKAVARLLDLAANVRREDAPALGLCPYKGLNYFDEADADLFVGREALTAKLVERVFSLTSSKSPPDIRFLAVVGASGSGKSSLVRAGLVSALRWNKSSTDWHIHVLIPTAHPLESLAASLTQGISSVTATATLMDDLAHDPRSLQIFTKRKLGPEKNQRLLLVVDQFEELFALCRSEEERASFISNLLTAASEADGPTVIVITLRADFYAHCANYVYLREALAQNQEYIGAMNDEELLRAIEEPARRGRWEFEPGLVDLLLHEVGHEPGALPLLSHALLETWQRRRGRTMTLSGYTSSGGVRGAIAETAETVFTDQFTREQQAIARRIFLRLTELSDEASTADTRRRATFNELILKPEEEATTHAVLKALADARLIITGEDSAEVAHEALIREWPTLRGWLEENREGLRLHRHLTEAAQEWFRLNCESDLLYRGARLTQAREWASTHLDEMNDLEREFLHASIGLSEREVAEREAQRQRELEAAQKLAQTEKARAEENVQSANRLRIRNRIITTVGAVALALAILASVFSLQSNQNATLAQSNLLAAQTAQAVAEVNFANAESLRLAAEANALLSQNGDPETAALLSIRALSSGYSPEADASLIRSISSLYNRKLFSGHTGWVYAVAFSPDGKYALTGSLDGSARLWNVRTGKEIRQYLGHKGGISAVAFSPDGKFIITGGNDQTARLWNAETGQQLRVFQHSKGVSSVAFSPGGKYILTNGGDKIARLWDIKTGQVIRDFIGHTSFVSDVTFSPDGQYVLTGSFDATARLWETETGEELHTLSAHTPYSPVTSVAFSPDGKYVVTGNDDRTVQLWDVESGQEVRTFSGHTNAVRDVAISPDGKYMLTGSQDKTAILWDLQSGQEVRIFLGHHAEVHSVAFSPDGQFILTGSEDTTARLWSTPESLPLFTFIGDTKGVTSIAYSPKEKYVLTGSKDGTARLWDVETGQQVRAFVGHVGYINSVTFSSDGKYIITGGDDHTARLWDVGTGKEIRAFIGHVGGIVSVALSPDDMYILTTGPGGANLDGSTLLWEVGTGKKVRDFHIGPSFSNSPGITMLAFSPDGKTLLIGGVLVDVTTGRVLHNFLGIVKYEVRGFIDIGWVASVAFSPNGKHVLTGSGKRAILWDLATGKEIRVFTDQTHLVLSVTFSPDGNYVLTGLEDGTAHLWDATSGQELRTFKGHTDMVTSVAFSPDGKHVLTGSEDGTARLWDTDYHDTIRFTCSLLWRDFTKEERIQFRITDNAPTCPKS